MDSKKHHHHAVKVVSGWFSFGVGVTLIVLTILLLSNSLKSPIASQGFNSVSVTVNSTLVPLPSSFSSTCFATSNCTNATTIEVKSNEAKNVSSVDIEEGVVLEKTHLGNFTESVNKIGNGSFSVEQGTHEANGSVVVVVVGGGEGNVKANATIELKSFDVNVNGTENNNVGNFSVAIEANKTTSSDYDGDGSFENCDIVDGRWVRDNSKPYYSAGSCPYIDKDFDCNLNSRPDDGFLKWKWRPYGCHLPRY